MAGSTTKGRLKVAGVAAAIALVAGAAFVTGRVTGNQQSDCRRLPDGTYLCVRGAFPKPSACVPLGDFTGGVRWGHCDPAAERAATQAAAQRRQAKLRAEAAAGGFRTVRALINYQGCIETYEVPDPEFNRLNNTIDDTDAFVNALHAFVRRHCLAKWKGR